MILVDASIWIDHFRAANALLDDLLGRQQVLGHPFVTGELAVGSLRARRTLLGQLDDLLPAYLAQDAEVRAFIEAQRLFGIGIGYVDAHLLASASITPGCQLWTRDKRLGAAAERLGCAAKVHR
jgi:predicted nucleic acid-binding protein